MAREYSFLTFDDRKQIEEMVNSGSKAKDIAFALRKNQSAIYRELKKGRTESGNYSALKAQTELRR